MTVPCLETDVNDSFANSFLPLNAIHEMFFCQVAEKMPKYRQHKLGICYEVYEQMYNLHLHIF